MDIKEKYGKGEMLTGEVKKILIETINEYLKVFQERRKKVTDEMVKEFMEIRPIDAMPEKFKKAKADPKKDESKTDEWEDLIEMI